MKIYTRPWWFRWTIGLIFSVTLGNLFYPARIIHFLNRFSFLVKVFDFFGQDIRPSHQVWKEDCSNRCLATEQTHQQDRETQYEVPNIKFHYEKRGKPALATYIFEQDGISEADRHYRIHCPGNGGQCARHFEELKAVTTQTGTTTITFTHPGIGESEGFVLDQDDLINAVFQQAKHLIDKGVAPHRITISGMSMGAAAAVCAVSKINEYYRETHRWDDKQEEKSGTETLKQTVNYFGDRTFSDLTREIVDQILGTMLSPPIPILKPFLKKLFQLPGLNLVEKLLFKILSYVLWLPCKILLILMNWDMQPQKHYDQLDCTEKAIVYVKPRTLGEGTGIGKKYAKFFDRYRRQGDTVIRTHVSLKTAPEQKSAFKQALFELKLKIESNDYKGAKSDIEELVREKRTINAIVHANLMKLSEELQKSSDEQVKTSFIEIVSAWKGERLEGIEKTGYCGSTNAHDARYQNIHPRQVISNKWLFTEKKALLAIADSPNLVDYYVRFDKAVKSAAGSHCGS